MRARKQSSPTPRQSGRLERVILLKVIDRKWMDHIDDMEQLQTGNRLTGIRTA